MKDELPLQLDPRQGKLGKYFRVLATVATCLVLDVFAIIAVALIVAGVADWTYNAKHAIPNPVERGDDPGLGLVVVFSAVLSLLLSVPLCLATFRKLYSIASKMWSIK